MLPYHSSDSFNYVIIFRWLPGCCPLSHHVHVPSVGICDIEWIYPTAEIRPNTVKVRWIDPLAGIDCVYDRDQNQRWAITTGSRPNSWRITHPIFTELIPRLVSDSHQHWDPHNTCYVGFSVDYFSCDFAMVTTYRFNLITVYTAFVANMQQYEKKIRWNGKKIFSNEMLFVVTFVVSFCCCWFGVCFEWVGFTVNYTL